MRPALSPRIRFFLAKNSKKQKVPVNPDYYALVHSQKLKQPHRRPLPSSDKRNMLITSALPYVNNKPHLGNIIGAVLSADVFARYCRLMGHNTLFICGTDEYGTASEVKALTQKTTPKELCDKYHNIHKQVYSWFDISFDHFGRTSNPLHKQVVQEIFRDINDRGLVEEKKSTQWFCSHCDLFLADRFIQGICKKCQSKTKGDQCQTCGNIFQDVTSELDAVQCSICKYNPRLVDTTHLYLKLSQEADSLKKWLEDNKMDSWSKNAKGITKGWFNSKIQDRCITRDLKWGVQVPLQQYIKKVFYVWFQAPLGYISITADHLGQNYKLWWQKQEGVDVQLRQFMGKDNVLFHSVICPIVLRGSNRNWQLPTHISATEHLRYEGGKFSKSKNIGVFGDQCIDTGIPVQYWRYYLLRVRPEYFDSDFDWDDLAQKCNRELLNSIGNLIHRILKFTYQKYGKNIIQLGQEDVKKEEEDLISEMEQKLKRYHAVMEKMLFSQGILVVIETSHLINQYIARVEFWKNPQQKQKLAFLLRVVKVFSVMMAPFMPSITAKINFLLGCSNQLQNGSLAQLNNFRTALMESLKNSSQLREPIPLMEQISEDAIAKFRAKYGSNKTQTNDNP